MVDKSAEGRAKKLAELESMRGTDEPPDSGMVEEVVGRNPDGSVGGSAHIGGMKGRKIYLFRKETQDYIECELYDEQHLASKGKIPAELHIICPSCGGESAIPPIKNPERKTLLVEYLDPPRPLEMPDNGEIVIQTARVTVEEGCTCNWPASNGKGPCGFHFKITDNILYRI